MAAGGRSGGTAITTGVLFFLALFIAPLVGAIPAAATAPALIVVGSLMAHSADISWKNPVIAVPAFLTMILIPLTFSIANGLAFGLTAYTLLRIARGEYRQVNWLLYILTLLFIARFLYLSGAG